MAQSEQTVDTTPRGQDIQQNNASLGKVLFIYFGILTDSVIYSNSHLKAFYNDPL